MAQKNFKFEIKNGVVKMVKVKPEPREVRGGSVSINNNTSATAVSSSTSVTVEQSALNGYFKKILLETSENSKSVNLENYLNKFKSTAVSSLSKNIGYKVIFSVCCKMTNGEQTKRFYFNSSPHVINELNNKHKLLIEMIAEILTSFYKKEYEGSGWTFLNFECVNLNYGKYKPFKGGCGVNNLPEWLKLKRATTCIISNCNKCFYWCILRHFNPRSKDKGRNTKDLKKIEKEEPNKYADFNGIRFPTSADDLEKFQKQNPHIHLIIYGVDENEERTPVIFDGNSKGNKCDSKENSEKIYLLLHEEHYYLINDLSRLLSSQFNNHSHKVHFCYKCQRGYKDENALNNHLKKCSDTTLIQLPEEDDKTAFIEFNTKREKPPSIVIYFDFESILIPVEDETGNKVQKHKPGAFSFVIVSSNNKLYKSEKYTHVIQEEGEDVAGLFVNTLIEKIKKALNVFVLAGKVSNFTPVLCHNLSGYDAHLCILKLAEYPGQLRVLPSNEEKYISFSKYLIINNKAHEVRFLDSFRFLPVSLSKLVDDTPKIKENFNNTVAGFSGISLDMLTKKGIYPYEWVDSFEKTKATKLPAIECFYSSLKKEGITEDEYKHALKAWDVFECKTFNDYQAKYCELDTYLLCDVFENFRKLNKDVYGLDPLIYGYTLPGTAWHNMLKFTKQKIKLITDRDIYEDFEKGIRGGVSMCVTRYAKANNKYLSDYDPGKLSNFIFYIDKNNLYGEAMSQEMPYEIERKLRKDEFNKWQNFKCALVCDLEIPRDKKDYLKDYPPAPEHLKINNVFKLVPNLKNKKEYLVYSELLKYYLKLGVKITKIHRGYVFKASKWLEPYISYNTEERGKTTETSKQNFFKLCINAIYGKTIENPRKRSNVELVNSEERAAKLIKSPEFLGYNILSPNLVSVSKKKTLVKANKPIYIGFCVLELAKLKMYELYYDYLKPKFGDRVKLLYTDTDSLILDIESDDLYEEMAEDVKTCFDTWKYPKYHPLHSMANKNRLGFFKDESKGTPIKDYAATCSKSYAYREEERSETGEPGGKIKENLKLKGVVECCLNKDICFNDYIKCIFDEELKKVEYLGFKSIRHEIYTEKFEKIALNPLQDVRHVLDDKINTVPIGYKDDEEEAEEVEEADEAEAEEE